VFQANDAFQLYSKTGGKWVLKKNLPVDRLQIPPGEKVCAQGSFGVHELDKEDYFVLKIGELKPVPGRYRVEIKE
jgi:hypothetical protein